jgi:O-antigen/teichoic acid export membrane protein
MQIMIDTAKILSVILLIYFFKINASLSLAVFVTAPLIGVSFAFLQTRKIVFSKVNYIKMSVLKELVGFSKWIFLSRACAIIFPYTAIFFIAKMLGAKAAGIYGLALNLTLIFPILIGSLKSVLFPEVSRFKELRQLQNYLKQSFRVLLFTTLIIIPLLFLSRNIILFFFGYRYQDSIIIFNWLLLSYLFMAINSAIISTLYTINKPHIITLIGITSIILMSLGCYFFIPRLGILAPAVVTFIIKFGIFCFLSIYMLNYIKKGLIKSQKINNEPINIVY